MEHPCELVCKYYEEQHCNNPHCAQCPYDFDIDEHDAAIRNALIAKIIAMINDHSNTRIVSAKKEVQGQHHYYRAISQTKLRKLLLSLKEE